MGHKGTRIGDPLTPFAIPHFPNECASGNGTYDGALFMDSPSGFLRANSCQGINNKFEAIDVHVQRMMEFNKTTNEKAELTGPGVNMESCQT